MYKGDLAMKKKISVIILSLIMIVSTTVIAYAGTSYYRIKGFDQYQISYNAVEYLQSKMKIYSKGVVICNGASKTDIASSLNLNTKYKYPIVFVDQKHEKATLNTVKKMLNKTSNKTLKVFIVGGTSVVRTQFEKELKKIKGVNIQRFAGKDSIATNKLTLNHVKAITYNSVKNKKVKNHNTGQYRVSSIKTNSGLGLQLDNMLWGDYYVELVNTKVGQPIYHPTNCRPLTLNEANGEKHQQTPAGSKYDWGKEKQRIAKYDIDTIITTSNKNYTHQAIAYSTAQCIKGQYKNKYKVRLMFTEKIDTNFAKYYTEIAWNPLKLMIAIGDKPTAKSF